MGQVLRASALVPRGFIVVETVSEGCELLISVRPVTKTSACPGCGKPSERVHSRYRRSLADLPVAGQRVRLIAQVRRFYCDTVLCGRRIFAERFDGDLLAPWARRTSRLEHIVHLWPLLLVDVRQRASRAD